jgi:hypothetical protein
VFEVMGLQDGAAPEEGEGRGQHTAIPERNEALDTPLVGGLEQGDRVAMQMAQGQVVASLDRLAQGAPLFDPLFGRVLFRVGHCRFPFVNGVETGAGLAIAMSPGLMWFRHVIYRSGRVPGRSAGDLRARKGRVQSHGVGAGTAANCYAVSPQDPSAP